MTTHIGRNGLVKVGGTGDGTDDGNIVAEMRSFSFEETGDTVECSRMGHTARQYKPTLTSFSGSMDVYWDETNSTGQGALTIGSEVEIGFYPEGELPANTDPTGAADVWYYGSAIVTGVSRSASFDGLVEASITVQGVGALSAGTAT